jgi:hypothetical protein
MVKRTNAVSTNLESPESVEHLCGKCEDYAERWRTEAENIWNQSQHKPAKYQNYAPEKRQMAE